MGSRRNNENSYARYINSPKLELVGNIDLSIAGQNILLRLEGQEFTVIVDKLSSGWSLRHALRGNDWMFDVLSKFGFRINMRSFLGRSVELFPNPGLAVRVASRQLRRAAARHSG